MPQFAPLGLLHTADVHVATFDGLNAGSDVELSHVVVPALLEQARTAGVTPAVRSSLRTALQSCHAPVVVCTCSTLGAAAEELGAEIGVRVLRVDRPLAEAAVAAGPRVAVVATLASTLEPTRALLESVAVGMNRPVILTLTLIEAAWPHFETGALTAYHATIRHALPALANEADVIVLAQASMAPAALGAAVGDVPVLSSPALGLAAGVKLLTMLV